MERRGEGRRSRYRSGVDSRRGDPSRVRPIPGNSPRSPPLRARESPFASEGPPDNARAHRVGGRFEFLRRAGSSHSSASRGLYPSATP